MDSKQIDYDFARAWDLSQGNFSEEIANSILTFAEDNNKKIKSLYDVCCGTSNLIAVFENRGVTCFGSETGAGMIEYSKEKHPNVKYYKAENMYDIPGKDKVDLITCNHDVVNYFEKFDEWKSFFKQAEKHLNKNGMFVFDFYTKQKLKNWNETTYSSSDSLDCLTKVQSGIYDKTMITFNYFVNYSNYYIKTKDIIIECYFETEDIVKALNDAGFKKVILADKNLNPLSDTKYAERIHVIAMKK